MPRKVCYPLVLDRASDIVICISYRKANYLAPALSTANRALHNYTAIEENLTMPAPPVIFTSGMTRAYGDSQFKHSPAQSGSIVVHAVAENVLCQED